MTILSPDALTNLLDLIASGASVSDATVAIGAARNSKIVFKWLVDSADAGEFDAHPDAASPWCIEWHERIDWLHCHYAVAQDEGRTVRSARKTPLRVELEAKLEAKRQSSHTPTPSAPPDAFDKAGYVLEKDRPAPRPPDRPSYARRAPPLNTVDKDGPPPEGRFSMSRHVVSKAERLAGTVEVTDEGIKRW